MGFAYGTTANVVIAGAAAGTAGGFVGARASGADLSTSFRAAYQGAAWGGGLAFAGSEFFHLNPSTQFIYENAQGQTVSAWKSAAWAFGTSETRYEVGRFAQNELGINGWEFNGLLEAASFAGNYLLGSPNGRIQNNQGQSGIGGFLERVPSTGILFQNSELAHDIAEFPFDTIDTVLQYQGLPDATGLTLIWGDSKPVLGFSAGALREANLVALGAARSGTVYGLPFGMIAPTGVNVYIGSDDPITGWSLGRIFNPYATILPTDHSIIDYNAALRNLDR